MQNDYVITSSEFPMLNAIRNFHSRFGSGTLIINADDGVDYVRGMMSIEWLHPQVKNRTLISWFERLIGTMNKLPDMQLMKNNIFIYDVYRQTMDLDFSKPFKSPVDRNIEKTKQIKQTFDKWAGDNQVPRKAIEPSENQVKDTLKTIMKEDSLTVNAHVLLLNMLCILTFSNVDDRNLVTRIANTRVNSMQYPNDTFINQLLYMVLISFIDPRGIYQMNNEQIKVKLRELKEYLMRTDAAATAIKQSIDNSLANLNADPSYPFNDGFVPNVGFNTRMSDTLEALDSARKTIVI